MNENVYMNLDSNITKNFKWKEFICPDNHIMFDGGTLELFNKLQQLRDIIGSITITSGYRSEYWNHKLIEMGYPASKTSNHMKAHAVDIRWSNKDWGLEVVAQIAFGIGLRVLIYDWGLHLDTDERAIIDRR